MTDKFLENFSLSPPQKEKEKSQSTTPRSYVMGLSPPTVQSQGASGNTGISISNTDTNTEGDNHNNNNNNNNVIGIEKEMRNSMRNALSGFLSATSRDGVVAHGDELCRLV